MSVSFKCSKFMVASAIRNCNYSKKVYLPDDLATETKYLPLIVPSYCKK